MAGFGGQGLMFIGKLLAQAGMEESFNVTYFPSYGAEVRGGTANCHVVLSTDEISSPTVETADSLLVMNEPSLDKFETMLSADGLLVANSTMIGRKSARRCVFVPASQLASDLGDVRVANLVMLGAYQRLKEILSEESLLGCLRRSLEGKGNLYELNRRAFEEGAKAAG
jgi:2-oxoglutarate ferredoxin oxidoreductase subunit gamma